MKSPQTDIFKDRKLLRLSKPLTRLLIVTLFLDVPFSPLLQEAHAADVPANRWVTVPVKADPSMVGLIIPADAYQRGMWSDVKPWPIVAVHAALLPDGRVMSFGTDTTGQFNGRYTDLWDPTRGFATATSHQLTYRVGQADSFCAAGVFLNNGNFLISGSTSLPADNPWGNYNKASTIFDPQANTMTAAASLASNRWYATMINLPNGNPIILGGMTPYSEDMENNPNLSITQGLASMTPELYENGAWRSLLGANSRIAFGPDYNRTSYPRAWVAPDGQVFGVSAEKMWKLDPNANGGSGAITYTANYKYAYSIGNPVNVGTTNTAVMYDIGKVAIMGGNGAKWYDGLPASNMVTSIDINGATPVLTERARMPIPRRMSMATVLATGEVVVLGGTQLASNEENGAFSADIWNPTTNTWTTGASASVYRGYHSNATLMPNGTILGYGSGWTQGVRADLGLKAEIYYPPNLFKNQNGASVLALRPVIRGISGLSYPNSADLQLDMSNTNTISRLVLVGLSNGTHAFNAGQRRIPLAFTQNGIRLTTVTPNANIAPPGYYQIVAIDSTGVPSIGTIIAIGNIAAPNVATTAYAPPNIAPGPVIPPPVTPPPVDLPPVIGSISSALSGAVASFSVTATAGVTYSWSFGDGSAVTAFSANPSVTYTYTKTGSYLVTVTARSTTGLQSVQTLQMAVTVAGAPTPVPSNTSIMPNSFSIKSINTTTSNMLRSKVKKK